MPCIGREELGLARSVLRPGLWVDSLHSGQRDGDCCLLLEGEGEARNLVDEEAVVGVEAHTERIVVAQEAAVEALLRHMHLLESREKRYMLQNWDHLRALVDYTYWKDGGQFAMAVVWGIGLVVVSRYAKDMDQVEVVGSQFEVEAVAG